MLATLLTDFGTADFFVGAMKGAILSVCPQAQVVDLTHEIPAHDIEAGAFTLLSVYESFPARTVHVAVVDPGVGSTRRAILMVGRHAFFIAPDNGLLSYVGEREREVRIFQLTNEKYFRRAVSATFHGRDLFAPVAGALLNGVEPEEFGAPIKDYVRLAPLAPRRMPDGELQGSIIHIDRFGNCITNLTREDLPEESTASGASLHTGTHHITSFRRFFAEATDARHEPFAIWGSAGFLEIAVFRDSAARLLNLERGQKIIVKRDK